MKKLIFIILIFLLMTTSVSFAATYDGNGDDYFEITKPDEMALIKIEGNKNNRHFAVQGVNNNGQNTKLFVNTTESYSGTRALDFLADNNTTHLEVKASGNWKIDILPFSQAKNISVGNSITGSGDQVLKVDGSPNAAIIKGNSQQRHFSILSWGDHRNLLVNTLDKYDGTVRISSPVYFLEITAVGDWTITLK